MHLLVRWLGHSLCERNKSSRFVTFTMSDSRFFVFGSMSSVSLFMEKIENVLFFVDLLWTLISYKFGNFDSTTTICAFSTGNIRFMCTEMHKTNFKSFLSMTNCWKPLTWLPYSICVFLKAAQKKTYLKNIYVKENCTQHLAEIDALIQYHHQCHVTNVQCNAYIVWKVVTLRFNDFNDPSYHFDIIIIIFSSFFFG